MYIEVRGGDGERADRIPLGRQLRRVDVLSGSVLRELVYTATTAAGVAALV